MTRGAVVVTTFEGLPSVAELRRDAAAGERPRMEYVELRDALAEAIGAEVDVVDRFHMAERAHPLARLVSARVSMPAGQILEMYLRRRRYSHVVAWADRIGAPLALLYKLRRFDSNLWLLSVFLTNRKKGWLMHPLRVWTHLRAIFVRTLQHRILMERFRVPPERLVADWFGVDERYWTPGEPSGEPLVCAVGWEQRDYATLIAAASTIDARFELAVGSVALPSNADELAALVERMTGGGLPGNVTLTHRSRRELRELLRSAAVVVVPVQEVEFDAGMTAVMESMSLAKPLVVTRTAGLDGLFEDGVHGLWVPPADPAAMSAAIQRLLGDPEGAAAMGRAARALIEGRHTLDQRIERIVSVVAAPQPSTRSTSRR